MCLKVLWDTAQVTHDGQPKTIIEHKLGQILWAWTLKKVSLWLYAKWTAASTRFHMLQGDRSSVSYLHQVERISDELFFQHIVPADKILSHKIVLLILLKSICKWVAFLVKCVQELSLLNINLRLRLKGVISIVR